MVAVVPAVVRGVPAPESLIDGFDPPLDECPNRWEIRLCYGVLAVVVEGALMHRRWAPSVCGIDGHEGLLLVEEGQESLGPKVSFYI